MPGLIERLGGFKGSERNVFVGQSVAGEGATSLVRDHQIHVRFRVLSSMRQRDGDER